MKNPTRSNYNVANLHGDQNKITNLNLTVNDVTPLVLIIEEQEAVIAKQKLFIELLITLFKKTKIWTQNL